MKIDGRAEMGLASHVLKRFMSLLLEDVRRSFYRELCVCVCVSILCHDISRRAIADTTRPMKRVSDCADMC